MAILQRHAASERHSLGSRFLIGRSRLSHLRLDAAEVSSEHACIYFNGRGRWEVRDLGSRNGTTLNGKPLISGRGALLATGDELCFGDAAERWILADDAPPGPIAREPGTSRFLSAEQGVLWLDDTDDNGVCVYLCEQTWVLEERGGQRVVEDGLVVTVAGRQWSLELPSIVGSEGRTSTVPAVHESALRFRFRVSQDQEQVHLHVEDAGRTVDLGVRAHHELLLTLARLRRQDESRGTNECEAGWVYSDQLATMLALDPEHAYVMVFRARQHLRQEGIEASRLIERRPASHQVRFGYRHVEEAAS